MNTATTDRVPILPKTGGYEYVLEDLELAFPKEQLKQITKQWNSGWEVREIAENISREPDEVFLALFHQARMGEVKRPFAFRPQQAPPAPKKGQKHKAIIDVKKVKKEVPTIIEIEGRRYVLEHKNQFK
ncbi:hypothetical protein [Virgibacillus sediminis]|uniref:Uncharacterized protein n=1 Tax=Virgibacillus sediminis TaxID=202260 RepID=A0ABV7A6V9_9BACI